MSGSTEMKQEIDLSPVDMTSSEQGLLARSSVPCSQRIGNRTAPIMGSVRLETPRFLQLLYTSFVCLKVLSEIQQG